MRSSFDNYTEKRYNFSVIVIERRDNMENNIEEKYKIDSNIVKNYVNALNSITEPMSQIRAQIKDLFEPLKQFSNAINEITKPVKEATNQVSKTLQPIYDSINQMQEEIKKLSTAYPNEQSKILTNSIKQIMEENNGIVSSRMIEPLEISRQYLSILESNNEIERVSRGIYQSPNVFEDSFYSFQAKYKKAIFSHMNALYFYGMTEEFPYNYTVTVPQSYHVDTVNEKCNVFYVSDDMLELGMCEVETPNGNKVRAYDLERSICDIIRSKNRMDLEQVKKAIRQYMKNKDKDMSKLSEYSKKMGINEQVMEMVGMFND